MAKAVKIFLPSFKFKAKQPDMKSEKEFDLSSVGGINEKGVFEFNKTFPKYACKKAVELIKKRHPSVKKFSGRCLLPNAKDKHNRGIVTKGKRLGVGYGSAIR